MSSTEQNKKDEKYNKKVNCCGNCNSKFTINPAGEVSFIVPHSSGEYYESIWYCVDCIKKDEVWDFIVGDPEKEIKK